jgi:hypothetical protein
MNVGQKVKVVGSSIQRSNGAAWPGETGKIIAVTGDGYRIRFDKDDFIAERVKDNEITQA